MTLLPATVEAYDLLHKGAICMAAMSRHGMKVDVPYLDRALAETRKEIAGAKERLKSGPVFEAWERMYGKSANYTSHAQLGKVLFQELKYKPNPLAAGSNSEHSLKHLDLPFVSDWFSAQKLVKAEQFLSGIKAEVYDGIIHSNFLLHTTESYRPSSRDPNYQNQPRRNKRVAEIVRSCVVPRGVFTEMDFVSHEVKTSCFYHHDPNFEKYVLGGGDMHRDSAMDVYCLTESEIGPSDSPVAARPRDATKNKFVFPGFYGSYYAQMTPDLWDMIDELELQTFQGVPMVEHLRRKGITARGECDPEKEPASGTFEAHVRKCQDLFWQRFPVYDQWKRDWWALYQRQGGVNTLSGFRMEGIFRRNQILCNANQAIAFHILLWVIIRARDEMIRRKMLTKIVLQIHDSLMTDGPRSEQADVVALLTRIATVDVRKHWEWITLPLKVDFVTYENSWYSKKKLEAA